ncbi:MAG: SDR family NAD(P)-dependent oxidoreductase [Gammaproteobacteria bacterium]|nr:SDR family NAD(P)-dependent oxidoreductase [Gammaproteobacteria bacterium]
MTFAQLAAVAGFYGRFTPSFSRIGFQARRLGWRHVPWRFAGQRWLVTGASAGIGRAIARTAAAGGAEVLAVARASTRLERIGQGLDADAAGRLTPLAADLSLISGTAQLLDTVVRRSSPFDVLINNAGVLLNDHQLTSEGHEASFVVNLLSHYQLTEGLIAADGLADGSTLVNMSSGGMYSVPLGLEGLDVTDPSRHVGKLAYARHKRAQVALTADWQDRLASRGIAVYVMHPGWVRTEGVRRSLPVFWRVQRPILRSPLEGADTALWLCATRPRPRPEVIWFDRRPRPLHLFSQTRNAQCTLDELRALLERKLAAR